MTLVSLARGWTRARTRFVDSRADRKTEIPPAVAHGLCVDADVHGCCTRVQYGRGNVTHLMTKLGALHHASIAIRMSEAKRIERGPAGVKRGVES